VKKEAIFADQCLHEQYFYLQPNSISMVLIKMDKQQSIWSPENTRAVFPKYLFIMQLINFTSFIKHISNVSRERRNYSTFYVLCLLCLSFEALKRLSI